MIASFSLTCNFCCLRFVGEIDSFFKFTRGPLLPPMLKLDRVSFVTVEKRDTLIGVSVEKYGNKV